MFSPQSPPLRREMHYVTELCSSLFFKLDTSPHIPFILSYRDPLRIAVLLTLNDPQALVDCPLGLRRAHWHHDVSLNILRLQYSDAKCQLWYFLHLGY